MMTDYAVLWKVLTVAPSGTFSQWVSVRTPTETEASVEALRHRPEWTVARVVREKNP